MLRSLFVGFASSRFQVNARGPESVCAYRVSEIHYNGQPIWFDWLEQRSECPVRVASKHRRRLPARRLSQEGASHNAALVCGNRCRPRCKIGPRVEPLQARASPFHQRLAKVRTLFPFSPHSPKIASLSCLIDWPPHAVLTGFFQDDSPT